MAWLVFSRAVLDINLSYSQIRDQDHDQHSESERYPAVAPAKATYADRLAEPVGDRCARGLVTTYANQNEPIAFQLSQRNPIAGIMMITANSTIEKS